MTMNLSGSLEAFGLDEVLALLGMGGRTARMQVSSVHGTGSLHLVDGHVSAASADPARAGLLRELVAAAAVPADDLAAALGQAQPVVALVDGGVVGRDLAHRVAVENIVDALGEMLAWQEGQFAVWAGEPDPADIGVRLPVAEAVERGRVRVQEWARVHEVLPEPDSVLALVPEQAEPPALAREDWAVLARVDGRRTLAEVLAAVGIAPLVASERVVQLMSRGLVGVRAELAAQPDEVAALIDAFEGRGSRTEPAQDAVRAVVEEGPPVAVPVVVPDDEPQGVVLDEAAAAALGDQYEADELPVADEALEASTMLSILLADEPEADVDVAAPLTDEAPVGVEAAVEVEAPVTFVPILLEDPAPLREAPWEAAAPAPEVTDPAVAAWLESATPADELVALVGQVPVDAPLPAEAPVAPDTDPVFSFPVEVEPVAWAPAEPPVTAPVAPEAVAPAVEWSPWAQALGLGAPAPEGELIVDPLAGPGIAEMIADAHGLSDTSDVPVPQAPVVPEVLDEQHPLVPGPREPEGQTWTVGSAEVPGEAGAAPGAGEQDEAEPVPDVVPAVAPAADPLSGGLLSQLMSGVRGL